MKIAISSQNKKSVTGHPGKCRNFWIFQIDDAQQIVDKKLLTLEMEQMFHQHPADQPHPLDEVDVLISGMMALWLQQRMAHYNVKAIATSETDLEKTLSDYLDGTLSLIPVHGGHGVKKPDLVGGTPLTGISIASSPNLT
ncbi:MAG: nitrogen fixation protein [Magnetococcales bacterium]|nr:nitrogen fixation protein [Magnetococcales bacterium]